MAWGEVPFGRPRGPGESGQEGGVPYAFVFYASFCNSLLASWLSCLLLSPELFPGGSSHPRFFPFYNCSLTVLLIRAVDACYSVAGLRPRYVRASPFGFSGGPGGASLGGIFRSSG